MNTASPSSRPKRIRKPEWLKIRLRESPAFRELRTLARGLRLTTVCEEARCPNIYECWGEHKTATFMLFGETCTRRCRFCAVDTGMPGPLDPDEPAHVAEAVHTLGLKHAVITSVNRDDLPDGGAAHFAATIEAIRARTPTTRIEVLIPDFRGDARALDTLMSARPDILGHNTETVPRLYRDVRVGSKYERTLEVLKRARSYHSSRYPVLVKSGVMCGLGEHEDELEEVMDDLLEAGVHILTLGQYLQPTKEHIPVSRYYSPEEFDRLRQRALRKGFLHVESGPLVRSSYHAHEHVPPMEV